jgi:hypothetical protein
MTKADFFLGRGRDSVWLGSVGSHGRPEMLNRDSLRGLQGSFQESGRAMVRTLAQGVPPDMGWPWRNGRKTEYTYAFDDGEIFVSVLGGPGFTCIPGARRREWVSQGTCSRARHSLKRQLTRQTGIFHAGAVHIPLRGTRFDGGYADASN